METIRFIEEKTNRKVLLFVVSGNEKASGKQKI